MSVTKNITLTQDLVCPHETSSVLTVQKKGITINGNGYKIIAPNAASAIRILSPNVTIKNIDLSGNGIGRGVEVFNAKNAHLTGLTIVGREIGINVHYDGSGCDDTVVKNNRITGSKRFGLRIDAADCSQNYKITNNDFSGSNDFAIYLRTKKINLSGLDGNLIYYSRNGLFLSAESVKVKNIDFSGIDLLNTPLYISQSKRVRITNVDVSAATHSAIGLHIYDSHNIGLKKVKASNHGIGIKIAGESAPMKVVKIYCSELNSNDIGLVLTAYTGSYLGKLLLSKVQFNSNDMGSLENIGIVKKIIRP